MISIHKLDELDKGMAMRMAQAQRVLEQALHRGMTAEEVTEQCLKISTRYYLSRECSDRVQVWARETYL